MSALYVEKRIDKEVVALLCEEVNVKQVVADKESAQGKWIKDSETGVELNITIDAELEKQGFVREVVRRIQGARKDLNLKPTDVIQVVYSAEGDVVFGDIQQELAQEVGASEFVQRARLKQCAVEMSIPFQANNITIQLSTQQ